MAAPLRLRGAATGDLAHLGIGVAGQLHLDTHRAPGVRNHSRTHPRVGGGSQRGQHFARAVGLNRRWSGRRRRVVRWRAGSAPRSPPALRHPARRRRAHRVRVPTFPPGQAVAAVPGRLARHCRRAAPGRGVSSSHARSLPKTFPQLAVLPGGPRMPGSPRAIMASDHGARSIAPHCYSYPIFLAPRSCTSRDHCTVSSLGTPWGVPRSGGIAVIGITARRSQKRACKGGTPLNHELSRKIPLDAPGGCPRL